MVSTTRPGLSCKVGYTDVYQYMVECNTSLWCILDSPSKSSPFWQGNSFLNDFSGKWEQFTVLSQSSLLKSYPPPVLRNCLNPENSVSCVHSDRNLTYLAWWSAKCSGLRTHKDSLLSPVPAKEDFLVLCRGCTAWLCLTPPVIWPFITSKSPKHITSLLAALWQNLLVKVKSTVKPCSIG